MTIKPPPAKAGHSDWEEIPEEVSEEFCGDSPLRRFSAGLRLLD